MKIYTLLILSIAYASSTFGQSFLTHGLEKKNGLVNYNKPYVVIISADGFRSDYAERYRAKNILRLSASGIAARSMIPSFPTITLPNHFAIMSGLYPAHSGITENYDTNKKKSWVNSDASFMKTEPIWITLEKQKLLTACLFWPDAWIPIQGILPTYYCSDKSMENRIAAFKDLLSLPVETRPHFIFIYFGATDHEGHLHGPKSVEVNRAVQEIDQEVAKLDKVAKASGLPVNFLFVSDHGMTSVDNKTIHFPAVIDTNKFIVHLSGPLINIYARDTADILPTYRAIKAIKQTDFKVYLKKDVPTDWNFGIKDDRYKRVGDILLMAKFHKLFDLVKPTIGSHGYLPSEKQMHASFYAWGPAFKTNSRIAPFKNIEVYDVMMRILKVRPLESDATGKLSKKILIQK